MSIKPLGYIEKGERVHIEANGSQFEGEELVKWYGLGIIFFGLGRVGKARLGMEQWGEVKGINVLETKPSQSVECVPESSPFGNSLSAVSICVAIFRLYWEVTCSI